MGKFYAKKLIKGDTKYKVLNDVPSLYRDATKQVLDEMLEKEEIDKETYNRILEIEE